MQEHRRRFRAIFQKYLTVNRSGGRLAEDKVKEIKTRIKVAGEEHDAFHEKKLADEFGVSINTIRKIKLRKTYDWVAV